MNSSGGAPVRAIKWNQVQLSDGEEQLAGMVALGRTDDEIALQLTIRKHTVEEQVATLLSKIGGRERVEILFYVYSDPTLSLRVVEAAGQEEVVEEPERKAS